MTEKISKLQIRAKVLSFVSQIQSVKKFDNKLLSDLTEDLLKFEDKETFFDLFLKEIVSMNQNEFDIASCLIDDVIPYDYVEKKVYELLKSDDVSDAIKYKVVQLIRVEPGGANIRDIPSYFKDPEIFLNGETDKLIEKSLYNPERMLDFLDFVSAVPAKDRNALLVSLKNDYQGEIFANMLYPILYSDFDDDFILRTIDILSESKSSLAIAPFNYLIEVSENKNIVNACKSGLKKLKLAGASEEKVVLHYKDILKDSSPSEFYVTIPDGCGNQAIFASRLYEDNNYAFTAMVVSDTEGVVSCFGFYDVSRDELKKVINKFYKSQGKYKVSPEYVKTITDEAFNLTVKLKRKFPYEFICWSLLIKDLKPLDCKISDFVEQNCKKLDITKDDILSLLTKEYTFRWFFSTEEDKKVEKLADIFYNADDINIDFINSQVKSNKDSLFDETTHLIFKNRMYNLIYILINNNKNAEADMFYTLLTNKEYFDLFEYVLMQRSIFNYYFAVKEKYNESLTTKNIFKKRNAAVQKYDIKKIDKLILTLERNWINE